MKIYYTKNYLKSLKKLPKNYREKLYEQEKRFKKDIFDSRLHIKQLKQGLKNIYSFRITRNYRVLFYFQTSENVIFFHIGNRKNVYNITSPCQNSS